MISHEENTEFSWKTEGQPLSGDKTVHSPLFFLWYWQEPVLQVPTLTEGAFQKSELAGRTMAGPDILAMN